MKRTGVARPPWTLGIERAEGSVFSLILNIHKTTGKRVEFNVDHVEVRHQSFVALPV